MRKTLSIAALGCASILTPLLAHAETFQLAANDPAKGVQLDCLLEGRVIASRTTDDENTVRIDFYKAEPYTPEARCIVGGRLEFNQPKGSLIENLSPGSVVQYHYHRTEKGHENWQLVGAFI